MHTNFQIIKDFIETSNSTNSNTDKINILKEYAEHTVVKKVLFYTYNTYLQYGVTSASCKKKLDLLGDPNTYVDFFALLDDLNNRVVTGHNAIANVNRYVMENKAYADIIWSILDRNLKTRSTASTINKAIPKLIPTFDVALAKAFDEKTQKKVDWNDGWQVSRKLDGCRCICIINGEGEPKFFSRTGKEFLTLDNLKPELRALNLSNMVFDGEICMLDENGDEDFQSIIKQIKRKDHTIENPYYWMFDFLTLKEFQDKTSLTTFNERITNLYSIIKDRPEFIGILDQLDCDDEVFSRMMDMSKEGGWEGLMLRKNTTYKGKRSDEILKVKQMYDEEYIVVGVENDIQRVIVDGAEVSELMLKNIIIEHKGNSVQVGSGFNHKQRRHYFKNPNEIIGKQVTIQYFEETTNMNGANSLRFPVIKAIYETLRDF
jgi:DNA ligase 1